MSTPNYIYAKAADDQPEEEGVMRFVASTADPDRHGDTIDQAGWEVPKYVPFLWRHDHDQPPLGKMVRHTVEQHQLMLDIEFDLEDEAAADIFRKYQHGILEPVSVGFIGKEAEPNDYGGWHFIEQELLELSAVPVGANPEAGTAQDFDEEALAVAKAVQALKDGRVLSEANYRDVKKAKGRLEQVLEREDRSPEEEDDDKGLGPASDDATDRTESGESDEEAEGDKSVIQLTRSTDAGDGADAQAQENEEASQSVVTLT